MKLSNVVEEKDWKTRRGKDCRKCISKMSGKIGMEARIELILSMKRKNCSEKILVIAWEMMGWGQIGSRGLNRYEDFLSSQRQALRNSLLARKSKERGRFTLRCDELMNHFTLKCQESSFNICELKCLLKK